MIDWKLESFEEKIKSKSYREACKLIWDWGKQGNINFRQFTELVKNLTIPSVSNWVAVSERLPEKEGMYYITNKYKWVAYYHIDGKFKGKWTVNDSDGFEDEVYPSYWKEIDEPPSC